MTSICIITARGGSKRIPRKNIKDFCGKPIMSYSIEAAIESGLFDEVMVSTDDGEIASIARSFGASVPFARSERNSDDYSTTTDVLYEVINRYKEAGQTFQDTCCIYPTAPFVTSAVLREAWTLYKRSGMDMLQPVVDFGFPPQRAYVIEDECLRYWMSEHADSRSQDLAPLYHDAGQFYIYRTESIGDPGRSRCPMILDRMRVQDIDTEEDWKLAEAKYRIFASGGAYEPEG